MSDLFGTRVRVMMGDLVFVVRRRDEYDYLGLPRTVEEVDPRPLGKLEPNQSSLVGKKMTVTAPLHPEFGRTATFHPILGGVLHF